MVSNFRLSFMEKNGQIVGFLIVLANAAELVIFSEFTALILCFLQQFVVFWHFCRISNNFGSIRKFSRKFTIFYRGEIWNMWNQFFLIFQKKYPRPWISFKFWRTSLLESIDPIGYCFRALPFQDISVIICPAPLVKRLVNFGLNFLTDFKVLNFSFKNLYDKKRISRVPSLLTPYLECKWSSIWVWIHLGAVFWHGVKWNVCCKLWCKNYTWIDLWWLFFQFWLEIPFSFSFVQFWRSPGRDGARRTFLGHLGLRRMVPRHRRTVLRQQAVEFGHWRTEFPPRFRNSNFGSNPSLSRKIVWFALGKISDLQALGARTFHQY